MPKQSSQERQNDCSIEDLRCNQGRRAFDLFKTKAEYQEGKKQPDGVIGLLMQYGYRLHHVQSRLDDFLTALIQQGQKELEKASAGRLIIS